MQGWCLGFRELMPRRCERPSPIVGVCDISPSVSIHRHLRSGTFCLQWACQLVDTGRVLGHPFAVPSAPAARPTTTRPRSLSCCSPEVSCRHSFTGQRSLTVTLTVLRFSGDLETHTHLSACPEVPNRNHIPTPWGLNSPVAVFIPLVYLYCRY